MDDYVIQAKALSKCFGSKTALNRLSMNVKRGGVHAFIGSNGAGKSTFFRIILGFQTPDSGTSSLLGQMSTSLTSQTRGKVGYVNEEHTLPGWLKVDRLIKMHKSIYSSWDDDIYRQVARNFDVRQDQTIDSLSRGERAGFNLAMALAQKPELLILDEPTLGLDIIAKQEFLNSILFTAELDTTIIYCSHQMDEVERLAEHLIIIEDGELRVQSSPEEFSQRVSMWVVNHEHEKNIRENLSSFLCGRVVEDYYQFYALDEDASMEKQLALLGVLDARRTALDLPHAVRAYLKKDHIGQRKTI